VAASRGLSDGDAARLVSARGVLPVRLECGDDVRPDSVLVAKGDWAKYDRGLNVLTEPRYTAGTGTAYNQNYVRLEPQEA
jgi:anaerobic selenocysteine-containing dehydrogenase